MERKRVGRPRHSEGEVKQSPVAVRTTPSVHRALRQAAEENGRSITQEVEARIASTFLRDAGQRSVETENLLNQIALEIAKIEEMTGRRWHRNRKTAGAVLEMLSDFPATQIRVDEAADDEAVSQAFDAWFDLCAEREDRLTKLAELGVRPNEATQAWLSDYVESKRPIRWRERQEVERLDLPPVVRRAANHLLEEIEALDLQVMRAKETLNEAAAPFNDAENEGRELYRKERQRRSMQAFARLQSLVKSVDVNIPKGM